MAITQTLLLCFGLGLLARHGAEKPDRWKRTMTVAENAAPYVGSVIPESFPFTATISSQSNADQFAVRTGEHLLAFTLTPGFTLDYETASSLVVVVVVVDTFRLTATGTVSINVTDVVEEFSSTIMYSCLSGTSYSAVFCWGHGQGDRSLLWTPKPDPQLKTMIITEIQTGSSLVTHAASLSSVTATYSITLQLLYGNHLAVNTTTGEISVATGKSINGFVTPIHILLLKLVSTSPSVTTSTSMLHIVLGCSSSSGAASGAVALTLSAPSLFHRLYHVLTLCLTVQVYYILQC